MKTENEIISEFMGDIETNYNDWNKIIPVLIKISDMKIDGECINLKFGTNGVFIILDEEFELYRNKKDVEDVRGYIVEFLNWYNSYKNKKQQTKFSPISDIVFKIDDHS